MAFRKFKLRTRLAVTYFIMALLPLLSLTIVFYYTSLSHMSELSRDHALEIIRKTNAQSDLRLDKVRESSLKLATDKKLHDIFTNLDTTNEYELIQADRELTNLLKGYFTDNEDLFSYQLATSYFMFGTSGLQGDAYGSKLYRNGIQAGGRLEWVSTYDVAELYNQQEYEKISPEERYYFSAVMQLKGIYLENGVSGSFGPDIETPMLIVTYKADYFKQLLDDIIPIQNASYMVLNQKGEIISHPDLERLAAKPGDTWIQSILQEQNGTENIIMDGNEYIVCFDTSSLTGWTSVVLIPSEALIDGIAPTIRNSALTIAACMFVMSFLLAFLLSRQVARPMKKLLVAIKEVGIGKFGSKIVLKREDNDEFGVVLTKFNEMKEKVQELIQENYESKLREKEAEIMALNVQLNPHFLYNTLNIMNWLAIEKEQKELSKMLISLSNMLHYTTHNYHETGDLQQELDWLKHYIFIMSERYKGKFQVEFDLDEALYAYRVPRLFLQPIVENAILHGFGAITEGGVIRITGGIREGIRQFRVRDNGRGMDASIVENLLDAGSNHIGLKNVNMRIQLLYGDDYGISVQSMLMKGTEVIVRLPCSEASK